MRSRCGFPPACLRICSGGGLIFARAEREIAAATARVGVADR